MNSVLNYNFQNNGTGSTVLRKSVLNRAEVSFERSGAQVFLN